MSCVTGKTREAESAAIAKAAGRAPLILLDPRGKQFTSEDLSSFIDQQAIHGTGELAFAIGGPEGHTDELRQQAFLMWGSGLLTPPLLPSNGGVSRSTVPSRHHQRRRALPPWLIGLIGLV